MVGTQMRRNLCPKEIAESISHRSTCRVKVGACLADKKGRVFSVGWNNVGSLGLGCCAEIHAITRANPKRLEGSSIFVYGSHRKTGNPCPAKPCLHCLGFIIRSGIKTVNWNNKSSGWSKYYV